MTTQVYGNKAGGAALDYSLEEQATGAKWVDGKEIYQKSVVANFGNVVGTATLGTIVDLDTVINLQYSVLYNNAWATYFSTVTMRVVMPGNITAQHSVGELNNKPINVTVWYTKQ